MKWEYIIPCDNERGWRHIEESDLLPCPKCGNKDLEVFANVVGCLECDYRGPAQDGPELMCDWRDAIIEWNNSIERAS